MMSNNETIFTVAQAANIFKVEKKAVKDWIYFFSTYLSNGANPGKGIERFFNLQDIRVMAYVSLYWEDEPDVECIKMGLNSGDHFDIELIDNFMTELTPFFFEPPFDIDESWKHGIVFGGLSEIGDMFHLAESYKLAGDRLIEIALENEEQNNLFCPAIYNYRHALELYLKSITAHHKKSHDLMTLLNKFEDMVKTEFNTTLPDWFKNTVKGFNDFDPDGVTFRYGQENIPGDEVFVDFVQMKTLVGWMVEGFRKIRIYQKLPV